MTIAPRSNKTLRINVRKIIARENLRRAETGEAELTQAELGALCGVSQSVISTLMRNQNIKRIDIKTIEGLCNAFGITPNELFEYN